MIAVDPVGSIVYDYFKTGKLQTRPKTYKIEGIGEDFIPKNYDFSVIDDMVQVEDKESHLMTRDLLTKEGLYVGVSSGSAVVGAMKWVQKQGDAMRGKNVLVILPDSGNRYLSKVFNDDWMREAGFLDKPSLGTVADILLHDTKSGSTPVIMAKQTDKVSALIELLRSKRHQPGSRHRRRRLGQRRGDRRRAARVRSTKGASKAGDTIAGLVDASVEFVTPSDPVEKVSRLVSAGKTPLVNDPSQGGQIHRDSHEDRPTHLPRKSHMKLEKRQPTETRIRNSGHPRGTGARSPNGRGDDADLSDQHLCARVSRQTSRLRIFSHRQSNPHRVSRVRSRTRKRQARTRLRIRPGNDRCDHAHAQIWRSCRLLR